MAKGLGSPLGLGGIQIDRGARSAGAGGFAPDQAARDQMAMELIKSSMAGAAGSNNSALAFLTPIIGAMTGAKIADRQKARGDQSKEGINSILIDAMAPRPPGRTPIVTGSYTGGNVPPKTPNADIGVLGAQGGGSYGLPSPDTGGAKGGLSFPAGTGLSDFGKIEAQYGLPEGYLSRTAQIESGMNPGAQNPNSSAGGLFQFIDSTASAYGLQDRFDPAQATDAAARLAKDNAASLRKVLGREPTAAELYLAHQQGGGGAAKLLANPPRQASTRRAR